MNTKPILMKHWEIRALQREIEAPGTGKTQTRPIVKLPTKTRSGGPIYERKDMGECGRYPSSRSRATSIRSRRQND